MAVKRTEDPSALLASAQSLGALLQEKRDILAAHLANLTPSRFWGIKEEDRLLGISLLIDIEEISKKYEDALLAYVTALEAKVKKLQKKPPKYDLGIER
jgi:hypothetical protein